MRLYHHPFSSNARRAVMTALHLGLDVDLALVDLAKGEQRSPAFLQKSIFGKVPVLEDGDFKLTESHAIMQYLAEGNEALYPSERRARADVNRWLFWSAHHISPSVAILNWERNIKKLLGQGDADPSLVAKGEVQVADCLKTLDTHLHGRKWLTQDRLTLADIAVATPLMVERPAQLKIEGANVIAWFGRVQELEAWKKTAL